MQENMIETKVRNFLIEDMIKEHVRAAGKDDELDLDSLDQTELRVFLDEEFQVRFADHPNADPFTSIQSIVSFVSKNASLTEAQ